MKLRVRSIRWEAEGIRTYSLEPLPGGQLPPFEAGAHVDLHLPCGLTRSYSLVNPQAEAKRYDIAVHWSKDGRGGSRHIHENVRAGDILDVSEPRNNFPLCEDARHSVFIAGGIGITPIRSMIARLKVLGRPWALHYAVSSTQRAAFLDELADLSGAHIYLPDSLGRDTLEMAAVIAAAPPETHFYCCGPARMLSGFEELSRSLPKGYAHTEYFSANAQPAVAGNVELVLQRSGRVIQVVPGETLLDALLRESVYVAFACLEGVCGTCQTRVLDGVPDHRDHFLTDEDKATNRTIMLCCSGAKTSRLILDL